jgi:hypothetical protein
MEYRHATLGYWDYSSAGREGVAGSAWSGRGFDANFGGYYSSFGIDVDLSYGHSEGVAPSWQSAGILYSSSVTVSYKPGEPPGLSLSAAAGNYDQNALVIGSTAPPYGSTFSDLYGASTNGEYWSMTAGADFTRLLWSPEPSDSGSAVKLLYSIAIISLSTALPGQRGALAMMIQRRF